MSCPLTTRITTSISSSLTSLRQHYSDIGLTHDESTQLLQQLESDIQSVCESRLAETRSAVERLQSHNESLREQIRGICGQLNIGLPALTLPQQSSGAQATLQQVKLHLEGVLTTVQEQKSLHITIINGGLSSLQQTLYPRLDISVTEVTDYMELVDTLTKDLSKTRIERVENEVRRMENLEEERKKCMMVLLSEMSASWWKLGFGESDCVQSFDKILCEEKDGKVQKNKPINLPPTSTTIASLTLRRDELLRVESKRTHEIEQRTQQITLLYKKIGAGLDEIKTFDEVCQHHAQSEHPLSTKVLGWYSAERDRLEVLKAEKIQSLIHELRVKINAVYKDLYMTPEETQLFKPLYSTIYNDAILEAHEIELYKQQNRLSSLSPIFKDILKYNHMKEELKQFELSSSDPNRFLQRGSHLILKQEEKMRKKRDTTFPALETKLIEMIETYELNSANVGQREIVKMNGVGILEQVKLSKQEKELAIAEKQKEKARKAVDSGVDASMSVKKLMNTTMSSSTPSKPPMRAGSCTTPRGTPSAATTIALVAGASSKTTTPAKSKLAAINTARDQLMSCLPSIPSSPVSAGGSSAAALASLGAPIPQAQHSSVSKIGQLSTKIPSNNAARIVPITPSSTNTRSALGELKLQPTVLANAGTAAVVKSTPMKSVPAHAQAVASPVNSPSSSSASFMQRFLSKYSTASSASEQLEILLGPYGMHSLSPIPSNQDMSYLLLQRAKIYEGFDTEEDRLLAEEDREDAAELMKRGRENLSENGVEIM